MGLLDDVGNVVRLRVNRTNPEASIFVAPNNRKDDWLRNSVNLFQRAQEERRAEEERRRRMEEERKKAEEERRQKEEERRRKELEFRQRDAAETAKYIKERDEANPVLRWAKTPEGRNFLTAGGAGKFDEKKLLENPAKYVVENKNFREFGWAAKGEVDFDSLRRRGVPDDVLEHLADNMNETGARPEHVNRRDYGGIPSTVFNKYALQKGLGLSEKRANQVGMFTQPIIDATTWGADSGSRPGADKWDALEAVTNKLAFKAVGSVGKGLFQKALSGAAINAASDAPVTYAQLRAAGYDNDEALKVMTTPGLMNPTLISGVAGGAFGAGSAAPRRLKGEAAQSLTAAGASYTGSRVAGTDEETARRNALMAAGAPQALRLAGKLGTKAGESRKQLTHEFGPEESLFHGSPGEVSGGVPTHGQGTGGKGGYITTDFDNARGYGENVYEVKPKLPVKFLDMTEPLEPDEINRLLKAIPAIDRTAFLARLGKDPTGFDADSAMRYFGMDGDMVLKEAGWDGWGWPQEYADYANEFVVKGSPDEIRSKLEPVAKHDASDSNAADMDDFLGEMDDTLGLSKSDDFLSRVLNRAAAERGLVEDGPSKGMNPVAQTALQSGAAGAYGLATGDEEDALKYAAAVAAGRAVTGAIAPNASRMMMGVRSPEEDAAMAKYYPKDKPLSPATEIADRMAKMRQAKLDKHIAQQKSLQAPPELLKSSAAQMDDFLAHAEVAVEDRRLAQSLVRKLGGGKVVEGVNKVLDPAGNFVTPHAKRVLAVTLASANYIRNTAAHQQKIVDDGWELLRPIIGGEPHLKRAALQAGSGAAVGAGTYAAGELTGSEDLKALAPVAAVATVAGVSRFQKATKYQSGAFENIEFLNPANKDVVHPKLQQGSGKLLHILQRPEMYDLTDTQKAAVEEFRNFFEGETRKTNAMREAAGMDLIPMRADHGGVMQWFTPDSVKKVLGPERAKAFNLETPGFDRRFGPDMERELGPWYDEALAKFDGLELISDPKQILKLQTKMHDQLRAQAMMVRNLKQSGDNMVMRVPTETEYAKMAPEAITGVKAEESLRRKLGWAQLPGIDDHIFAPEVTKAVEDLLVPNRGVETGPLAFADAGTNLLRGLMFTGDASAWTMQGAMLALNDPIGTIKNAPHLIGATVLGKRYFDTWLANPKNREIWDAYTKSGGVAGLEHEGLEHRTFSVRDIPGLDKLEERGFEAFLPIHRALMWKNLQDQNRFINAIGGKVDPLGVKRLMSEVLRDGAALGGVAYAVGEDDDMTDWESAMAVALGFATTTGIRVPKTGLKIPGTRDLTDAIGRRAPDDIQTRVQSAKQVNRTSGALNRQELGITAKQAQWERTLAFRSPALARNTLILAKKAMTDFGPEGAMARFYLVKTGILLGTGLAAAQYASTGEWPSFDPRDPDSIFNPLNRSNNFLRADLGGEGKFSFSNPMVSLVRALVTTDRPDDVRKWRMEDWEPLTGLASWYGSRQPDIVGPLSSIGSKEGFTAPLPLAVREMYETGLNEGMPFEEELSPVNDALNLEPNKDFTSLKEKLMAVGGTFLGINASPETRGQELKRIKNETALRLADENGWELTDRTADDIVDANDLNQEQLDQVKEVLAEDKQYQKVKGTFDEEDEAREEAGENPGPVQAFADRRAEENNEFEQKMRDLDARYRAKKISAFEAKAVYQYLNEEHRTKQAEIEKSLGGQWAGRKGTKETVLEYYSRYAKPEDQAVEKWYELFDQATKMDGSLDFNKLEKLRLKFTAGLDDETRRYVAARVASFDKPESTQFGRDYERAKKATEPYWDIRSRTWNEMGGGGIFGQFKSYGDFEMAIEEEASKRGVEVVDLYDILEKSDPMFRLYNKLVQLEQTAYRAGNPMAEDALVDFYNRAPLKGSQRWLDNKLQQTNGIGLFGR